MFWSGNFIVVRELNFLLKEENVTLSQVLEADDILQECKADNKALMQFLTRPDILAELITLITEEPSPSVELSQQYRHASIACEVLTSSLSMLSDRLSLDTAQMNRLCDFVSQEPPLNPLLASYFSKTVEMLLERGPKQDWYLYHIVCLRVLDFFKSRRDFLPNLLRHISTSAIADTFKFFIRLDDLFNKIIMEWLEEHQFLESVVGIICGTYSAEEPPLDEKGQHDPAEKLQEQGDAREVPPEQHNNGNTSAPAQEPAEQRARVRRRAAEVGSANAAALLCDLVATGCAPEGSATRSRTSWTLVSRLQCESGVRGVLGGVFTSGARARRTALVHGCDLLLALLHHPHPSEGAPRSAVELAVAPHLPLLHQALLHDPAHYTPEGGREQTGSGCVGGARLQVAALLAHLAASEVQEVATTLLTLGTASVLLDMFFRHHNNNFLHAHVATFCTNALRNPVYGGTYCAHLLVECDLLTRLMDAFEDNENRDPSRPRAGYMGRVVQLLGALEALEAAGALEALAEPVGSRWDAFRDNKLQPVLHCRDTPLGGSYPSDNLYEADNISDGLAANYDFSYAMATANMDEVGDDLANDNELGGSTGHPDSADFIADGLGIDDDDDKGISSAAMNSFLERANERFQPLTDESWEDAPEPDELEAPPDAVREVLQDVSPWATSGSEGGASAEGWAQFGEHDCFGDDFRQYWDYTTEHEGAASSEVCSQMSSLQLSGGTALASHLLTAMSAMSPDALANLVNANLNPLPITDLTNIKGQSEEITQLTDQDSQSDMPKDNIQTGQTVTQVTDHDTSRPKDLKTEESVTKSEDLSGVPEDKGHTSRSEETVTQVADTQPTDTPKAQTDTVHPVSTQKVEPAQVTQPVNPEKISQTEASESKVVATNISAVSETLPSDVQLPDVPSVISVVVADKTLNEPNTSDSPQKESSPVDESSNSLETASESPDSPEVDIVSEVTNEVDDSSER